MVTGPEKRRAREAVKRALASGRLVKPRACEGCGLKRDLEAHHPDYSKALAVEWLCPDCHGVAHFDAGDMERSQLLWAFSGTEVVDLYLPPRSEGGEDADYVAFLSAPD